MKPQRSVCPAGVGLSPDNLAFDLSGWTVKIS